MMVTTTIQTRSESICAEAQRLWETGQYAEARALLEPALKQEDLSDEEILAFTNLLTLVERDDNNLVQALYTMHGAGPVIDRCRNRMIAGKCHNTLASVNLLLEDFDKAIWEFTAASICHEEAGDMRRRSETENNLACVLMERGYYPEAHEHLDRALEGCTDPDRVEQISDTRARVLLGEAKPYEALKYAHRSVQHFGRVGNMKLLAVSNATLAAATEFIAEAEPVKWALIEAGGDVETAAQLLGMKKRQNLEYYIRKYPHLQAYRAPVKKPRGRYAKSSRS